MSLSNSLAVYPGNQSFRSGMYKLQQLTMEEAGEKPKLFKICDPEFRAPKEKVILSSTFSKLPSPSPLKYELKLYKTMISATKIASRSDQKYLKLEYSVSFEIIRQPVPEKKDEPKRLGKALGVRFLCDNFKAKEFYTDNVQELDKWSNQLGRLINERGFHQMFKAMRKVGKGNFASVYLGQRLKDGKHFAIKAFAKEATYSQQNGREAVINEIKINRMFEHPNLMKIEGVFESDNSIYLILEYIEGSQLYTRIQTRHKFSDAECKHILKGLLRAIAELARKNVIHRDLKPENIIFRKESNEPVIVDFGLATVADEASYLFVRCGTPGFVAPEIINIKDMSTKSTPIADVFSIGAIFYHLLFGKSLFPGRTFNEVLAQNRECDLVLGGSDFQNITYSAGDLLRKMLQKQPELRISAAEALRHPYFQESTKSIFLPKIMFKESASCPTYLIDQKNQGCFKMIVKEQKEQLGKVTKLETITLTRSN